MDFINEEQLYNKVVQPAVVALSDSIEEVIEKIRHDLDGAELEISIPEIKITPMTLKFKLKIPE
jgi:hypothetical protein